MKVKELIAMLEKLEPELDVYTFYDHGVVHDLDDLRVVLVDDDCTDKYTPRGVMFCAHHDHDMEFLIRTRKYKTIS